MTLFALVNRLASPTFPLVMQTLVQNNTRRDARFVAFNSITGLFYRGTVSGLPSFDGKDITEALAITSGQVATLRATFDNVRVLDIAPNVIGELFDTLAQLDRAVYQSVICNPGNGLTPTEFDRVATAHARALAVLAPRV